MDKLELKLREVYTKDRQLCYETCRSLLNIKDPSRKKAIINGNVCEILLSIMTEDYISSHPQLATSYATRGLIVNDPNNSDSNFCTELDYVLWTPHLVILFECKSYAGSKVVTEDFTLTTPHRSVNVFEQNALHTKTLFPHIQFCKTRGSNTSNMMMASFIFSNGDITDKRSVQAKSRMPLITQDNLYKVYDRVLLKPSNPNIWDIGKLHKFTDPLVANEEVLRKKHASFLGYHVNKLI